MKEGSIIKIGNTEMEVRVDATPSYGELVNLVREVRLESKLPRWHAVEDARRLANSFRIILEINDQCCNTDTRVKELNSRLDTLKESLADDAMVAEVGNLQRRISTDLYRRNSCTNPRFEKQGTFAAASRNSGAADSWSRWPFTQLGGVFGLQLASVA